MGKNKSFPKDQAASGVRGKEGWLGDVGNGKRAKSFLKQKNDASRAVP